MLAIISQRKYAITKISYGWWNQGLNVWPWRDVRAVRTMASVLAAQSGAHRLFHSKDDHFVYYTSHF